MHSFLIAHLNDSQRMLIGWALIILASFNILGNMFIVIYYSSGEIGNAIKKAYQTFKENRDLEKRLFANRMILGGVNLYDVMDLRLEYEALIWMRSYMPHRQWMVRNNVEMTTFPDEIKYQAIEVKFRFTQRRQ